MKYAIRIPANDSLERNIAELPTRPMACPSHKPVVRCKSFLYQAASWKIARRMVADEVRLWLSGLAYNPGNPWRRLVLPKKIENWTLTSLQRRLVKAGAGWSIMPGTGEAPMERSENTGLFCFGFFGRATMGSYMLFECRSETPRKHHALTPGKPNQNDKPESTRTSGTHKLSTPTTNRDKEE